MQQNLINYRQRISQIVSPVAFFKERKRSETIPSEHLQLKKRIQSLHLPEIQLFGSINKSFEVEISGFETTQNQNLQNMIVFNFADTDGQSLKKSVILTRNSSPKNRKLQRRGTLMMIEENDQRKFENWQNKFRRKTSDIQIHVILNYFVELFASMQLKHYRHLIDIYCDIAPQIVPSPTTLIRFTLIVAAFFLEIKDNNKSSFLALQVFIISKMLSLHYERARIMLFFSKVCLQAQQYTTSLQFLEDSLAYSWLCDRKEEEAQSYEAMGLTLFYMQQQTKARIFHFKYVNGQFEPNNSSLRWQVLTQVQLQERLMHERGDKQDEINNFVLNKISLPFVQRERNKMLKKIDIASLDEVLKNMGSELSDVLKYETILQRDIQLAVPKLKIRETGVITEKYLEQKRKAIKQQWKQRDRISSLTINNNLKEYIKQRNQSFINYESVFKKVRDSIGFRQQKDMEPIYIQQYQNKSVIQYIKKVFEQQLFE